MLETFVCKPKSINQCGKICRPILSLGDDLSWFIEVLGFMGADIDSAIDIMIEHFNQEKSKDLKL